MPTPKQQLLLSSQQLSRALDRLPFDATAQLATASAKATQQLKVALYSLGHFVQTATQYRNQLLGQALDPTQYRSALDIIDLVPPSIGTIVQQPVTLTDAPIAGWDFTTDTLSNLTEAEGQPIFEPEFIERVAYLLSELAQDEPDLDTTAALLSVDRLDLLLTLTRAEATRLIKQLQALASEE